jgi:hypothetical protein
MRRTSITGSTTVVPLGAGQPGAAGIAPAFAASQSAGAEEDVPTTNPGWKAWKEGLVCPVAAA